MLRDLTRGHHDVIIFPFLEVALVKVAIYGDDPMGTRYLKLEVGVVGDDHKLGIAWPTQDGVISAWKFIISKVSVSMQKFARPLNIIGRST